MLAARAAAAGIAVDELDPTAPLFATATGGRMPHWADLSVHGLRHAFNTIAKLAGASLEQRQHALGHADPRTTQRYDRARDNLALDPSTLVENATAGNHAGL